MMERRAARSRPSLRSPDAYLGEWSLYTVGSAMQPSELLKVEKPAVLVDGRAPYAIVDVNEEWLTACSYASREQVVGQTLSIIQV